MHADLARLAQTRQTSVGELVRDAVRRQCGLVSREERLAAADRLASLSLPVGTVEEMIAQSQPPANDLP